MFKDIIGFNDCLDASEDYVELGDVTFLKDFGSFKKGDKIDCLHIDYEDATIAEINEDGQPVKTVKFVLQPVVE